MKYQIGQQYREYYSETEYLTYTIVDILEGGSIVYLSITNENNAHIDPSQLGYISDGKTVEVFPEILNYMEYLGVKDSLEGLKIELLNCLAQENYERCCEIRNELKTLGALDKIVKELKFT